MKTFLFLGTFLLTINLFSQSTYVPDDDFENYLETNGLGNGIPNDDYVTTSSISVVDTLNIEQLGILDLTGIEDFASLVYLDCSGFGGIYNFITSLDLSQNTNLTFLNCNANLLTSLDLSQNSNLTYLFCSENQLTSLDLTQNSALAWLFCLGDPLTSLDLSQNVNLTHLNISYTSLGSVDLSQNVNLNYLWCESNQLTALDVSQNTALIELYGNGNQITTLDVSPCTSLNVLQCGVSPMECLNANNGQNLSLYCAGSSLLCVSVFDPLYSYVSASYDPWVQFDTSCAPILDNDINQFGNQLTAEQNGATYQWLDCDNNYAMISGEIGQSFEATSTGQYAVEITLTNPCESPQIDTSSCHFAEFVGIDELIHGEKEIYKIIDPMGRETIPQKNKVYINVYTDGTTERVFKLED